MGSLLPLLAIALGADVTVGTGRDYATILEAINAANDGDRILIRQGAYNEASWGNLDGRTLTFEAESGPGTVTVTTSDSTLIDADFSADLAWLNLDFDGQDSDQFALVRRSTFEVVGSDITAVATSAGAAIASNDSAITVTDCTLEGTTAAVSGSLIDLNRGSLDLSGGLLRRGNATAGGAINASPSQSAAVTIDGTTFASNVATTGSAIEIGVGSLVITNASFTGNTASTGTIRCTNTSPCSVSGSTFDGNAASSGAFLISSGGATTDVRDNVFCRSTSGGKHLRLANTTGTVRDNIFYNNTGMNDALVTVDNGSTTQVIQNTFANNASSTSGSAIAVFGSVVLQNNLIASNSGSGAAVQVTGGTLNATYNLFFDNSTANASTTLAASNLIDIDPLIAPVGNSCDTSALVPDTNSPAIDAGNPAIVDGDGSTSDIGAFTNLVGNPNTDGDDDDGDGYSGPQGDCNDSDATIHPGAAEVYCDGIDQDCDPSTTDDPDLDGDGATRCNDDCDDEDPTIQDVVDVYFDGDGDGFGRGQNPSQLCGVPGNGSLVNGDCNDEDPEVYPGAIELQDKIDQDCDGSLKVDNDGDGSIGKDDCNDFNPNRFPENPEIPFDGKDQDCDGYDGELSLTGGSGFRCGCASDASPLASGWLVGLLALAIRRRRD